MSPDQPDTTPEQTDNRERPEDGEQDVPTDAQLDELVAEISDDEATA